MDLRQSIIALTTGFYSNEDLRTVVSSCHHMAIVYLRKREKRGGLDPGFFGLLIEDLAMDCIAELFERDETGVFVRLCSYYQRSSLREITEADVLGLTRRLVFSAVNQELYERYMEADPSLHKLIRTIKDAVSLCHDVSIEELIDGKWIIFNDRGFSVGLDLIPPAALEAEISPLVCGRLTMRTILESIAGVLRERHEYRGGFPLVEFGRVVRSAFVRCGDAGHGATDDTLTLYASDTQRAIDTAVDNIRRRKRDAYVAPGKTDGEMFALYLKVTSDMLTARYVGNDGVDTTLFEQLREHIPSLSHEEYSQSHRSRVEHLFRLAHNGLLDLLRREW